MSHREDERIDPLSPASPLGGVFVYRKHVYSVYWLSKNCSCLRNRASIPSHLFPLGRLRVVLKIYDRVENVFTARLLTRFNVQAKWPFYGISLQKEKSLGPGNAH